MLTKFRKGWKLIMENWTEDKGKGLTAPDGGAEHSGDAPDTSGVVDISADLLPPKEQTELDKELGNHFEDDHTHVWKRGVLPGQKYVKTCKCGSLESVSFEEWQRISDR